jgi:U3 small nucleolar RNA-associated protein 6
MPGTSDKAQYYLEQSVPQLQELLRKEIFTPAEIKSITRKRSDYEHTINARGQTPNDYASYATYEINLAALIKKRTQRLKVKLGVSGHASPRTIFFILERGVRKFPGDLGLWMQLLGFARKEKARKKVRELVTSCLRLHPTKSALWVWAAEAVLEDEADMSAARSYLQRGLRFCKRDRSLWLEYARLECIYIARIAARRRILGLEGRKKEEKVDEGEDMLALPDVTAEDINPSLGRDEAVDEVALQNLQNTPALTGAIPIAIFDSAMKEFDNDAQLGEQFFDMVAEFERGSTFDRILRHIVTRLEQVKPDNVHTITCQFMLSLTGVAITSEAVPDALTESLATIRAATKRLPLQRKEISQAAISRLTPLAVNKEMDDDVSTALVASIRQYVKFVGSASDVVPIVERLQEKKQTQAAKLLLELAVKVLPQDVKLNALTAGLESKGRDIVMAGG